MQHLQSGETTDCNAQSQTDNRTQVELLSGSLRIRYRENLRAQILIIENRIRYGVTIARFSRFVLKVNAQSIQVYYWLDVQPANAQIST